MSPMAAATASRSRRPSVVALALALLALTAAPSQAQARDDDGDDGRARVRVAGTCGLGASSRLELEAEDAGAFEVRFWLRYGRSGARWRVALVHERRVVWSESVRTRGSGGAFEVRRQLRDLVGADAVTARAWGPRGLSCRASAILPES